MTTLRVRSLSLIAALLLAFLALAPAISQAAAQTQTTCSSYYVVRPGETWNSASQATGVTVTELRRANPQAVRPNGWLWMGDRLCVPAGSSAPTQPTSGGYWYQVKPGDAWNTVSAATGVSIRELWRANPGLLNAKYWLYLGQRVWIPAAPPSGAAPAEATPAPTTLPPAPVVVEPTPTVVVPPTPLPTPTQVIPPSPTPTQVIPPSPTPTQVIPPTPLPTPTQAVAAKPTVAGDCPATLADYPAAILAHLNTAQHGQDLDDLADQMRGQRRGPR